MSVTLAVLSAARRHKRVVPRPWWTFPPWIDDPYCVFYGQLKSESLCVSFHTLIEAAERVLGRGVSPSEFLRPVLLLREARALHRWRRLVDARGRA